SLIPISSLALQLETNNPATAYPPAATGDKTYNQQSYSPHIVTSSATEIVQMKEKGLDVNVLRAYVQSLREPFKATVDDIIYLHQNKVPDDLISQWINKGSDLVHASAALQAQQQMPAPPAPAQPAAVTQPAVVYQSPQVVSAPPVVYNSPSYVYSDYYWPSVSLGFSWGYPYWGYRYPYYYGHYGHGYYGHGGYYGGHYLGGSHWSGGGHSGGSSGGGG